MTPSPGPRRALFAGEPRVPLVSPCDHYAGTERRMEKALALQAERGGDFDVTLDLEDGAPTGREAEHRDLVVDMLRTHAGEPGAVGVRVHDFGSPHWRDDLDVVVRGAGRLVSHVTLPKAVSARQVQAMITELRAAGARAGLDVEIPVHVLVETHGLLAEVAMAAGLPWVAVLDFGLMDFVSGHHGAIPSSALASPGQFEHELVRRAKTEVAAAALAHGVVPSHNVTVAFDDVEATRSDARRARDEFGFLRMWSIHPAQIDPILEAFRPSDDDVDTALAILRAGQAADWAPIRHDGRLHDRASYRLFWHVVERAHAAGRALPDDARAWLAEDDET